MNRFLWLALLLSCTVGASVRAQHGFRIEHLTGEFYVYTTYKDISGAPYPSNSMYVLTDSGIVMIDTPWDITETDRLVDSISKRHSKPVIACIVTHFHDDRTAGLRILSDRGIQTYSSYQTWLWCDKRKEPMADHYFVKDTIFRFGNHTIHTYYPGPGHAPDNIVIWFPGEKILYGGCLVKSVEVQGLGNLEDASLQEWPRSIKKVAKKYPHPQWVIPGHYGWSDGSALTHTLRLLRAQSR